MELGLPPELAEAELHLSPLTKINFNMLKIFLIIFTVCLFNCLIISPVYAGLVPCGCDGCACNFCHFFIMLDRIIDFTLFMIVFPAAVLMLVIGGVMFLVSAGKPETYETAKKIITSTLVGLFIIFSAWILISMFFDFIGVMEWTELRQGWWQFQCDAGCECY